MQSHDVFVKFILRGRTLSRAFALIRRSQKCRADRYLGGDAGRSTTTSLEALLESLLIAGWAILC